MNNKSLARKELLKLRELTLEEKNDSLDWLVAKFERASVNKFICLELNYWIITVLKILPVDMYESLSLFPELYELVKREVIASGSYFNSSNSGLDIGVIKYKDNKYRKDLLIQLKKDINK